MDRDAVGLEDRLHGTARPRAEHVLVVVRERARCGELVGAVQDLGIPAVQGSTVAQALYWARSLESALALLEARAHGWRTLMRDLLSQGRIVVALADDQQARVEALERGCTDAVSGDIAADELALKVAAMLRGRWGTATGRVAAGRLVVDPGGGTLRWKGVDVPASPLLLRLAAYLATHQGRIVPTRVLLEEVWGEPWADPGKVHQAIWRLRHLLHEPPASRFLVGRQRHGYGLFPDDAPVVLRRHAPA